DFPEALSCLGHCLLELGKQDEALAPSRRAIKLKIDAQAHSNYLLALNYHPDLSAHEVFEEHRGYATIHEQRWCQDPPPHSNDRSSSRRLRIGYVSPDFRAHSVGYFILPVL